MVMKILQSKHECIDAIWISANVPREGDLSPGQTKYSQRKKKIKVKKFVLPLWLVAGIAPAGKIDLNTAPQWVSF